MRDAIDIARAQWAALLPGVDTSPLDVFGRVRRINELLLEQSDVVLASHGVSRADFDILSVLSRFERPMTLSEVAKETLTSAPGTTKRIKRLVSAGLIERETNPRDGRGALATLTPAGLALVRPVIEEISRLESSLLSSLSPRQNSTLVNGLRGILVTLEMKASPTES